MKFCRYSLICALTCVPSASVALPEQAGQNFKSKEIICIMSRRRIIQLVELSVEGALFLKHLSLTLKVRSWRI